MFASVFGEDGQLIVNLGDGGNGIGRQTANAHLISAAPDLLTACELFKKWMLCGTPGPHSDSQLLEIVDRAIAKATSTEEEKR